MLGVVTDPRQGKRSIDWGGTYRFKLYIQYCFIIIYCDKYTRTYRRRITYFCWSLYVLDPLDHRIHYSLYYIPFIPLRIFRSFYYLCISDAPKPKCNVPLSNENCRMGEFRYDK